MGERGRKVLAIGHAAAAVGLIASLVLQSPYMAHVLALVVLHVFVCYGLLRPQPWAPWLMGILASAGIPFAAFSIYAPIEILGTKAWETYAIIVALSAYAVLQVASLAYAVRCRREFSPEQAPPAGKP